MTFYLLLPKFITTFEEILLLLFSRYALQASAVHRFSCGSFCWSYWLMDHIGQSSSGLVTMASFNWLIPRPSHSCGAYASVSQQWIMRNSPGLWDTTMTATWFQRFYVSSSCLLLPNLFPQSTVLSNCTLLPVDRSPFGGIMICC